MIKLIFQNWWRRKERFFLLLVGVIIISAGLTYLVGLSNQSKGTVEKNLQERWTASYDIVVRPEGSRSVTENKNLLEPNYMSGLSGGISMEQYETIKGIEGVEVAAPIAMIGYSDYTVAFGDATNLLEPGIYRRKMTQQINNGLSIEEEHSDYYFTYPNDVWNYFGKDGSYGTGAPLTDYTVHSIVLLAAIDPEQENKLIGLENAIVQKGSSRYFNETDRYHMVDRQGNKLHEIPIIVNAQNFVDTTTTISFERVNIPFTRENANETMEEIREKGGGDYLETLETTVVEQKEWSQEEIFQKFVSNTTGVDWETGEEVATTSQAFDPNHVIGIAFKPNPIQFEEMTSPFAERWPFSYQIVPIENGEDAIGRYRNLQTYRVPNLVAEEFIDLPRLNPKFIGFYDASKLKLSMDPTTELPMETYRPATARFVMDSEGNPISPAVDVKPTDDPLDFLTNPPGMLTTLEAAENILGEDPISTIRIKVAGVSALNEDSQQILERVAKEIEEKTGLITDITLGSSPQLALTYVPGLNGEESIGWIEQPWVNIGSAISIFKEANIGFITLMISVVVVAITYVWSASIVNVLARRKEFAVLLAIGWRPSQLNRMLLIEGVLIGLFATSISWFILGIISVTSSDAVTPVRFLLTGVFALTVYIIGALLPMNIVRKISPYEAMREGEITVNGRRIVRANSIYAIAANHFLTKWKRSFLSVLAIALPSTLLAVFLYITVRMQGVMFTSLLGEYVAFEVGTFHYVAIAIALLIALLTTAEINWQNVSERQQEIGILQAIGWRRDSIRKLILAEGLYTGIAAMIFVVIVSTGAVFFLYGELTLFGVTLILLSSLVPILTGLIGTLIPAERASRLTPMNGIRGVQKTSVKKEKLLRRGMVVAMAVFITAFGTVMVQAIMKIADTENSQVEESYTPTEGVTATPVSSKSADNSSTEVESSEADYVNPSLSDYSFEISSRITSDDLDGGYPRDYFYIEAKKVSDSPLAIEFTFENREDWMVYYMKPNIHFYIKQNDQLIRPKSVEILEVVGMNEENYLVSEENGMIRAVFTFEDVDPSKQFYFVYSNGYQTGRGYAIRFDHDSPVANSPNEEESKKPDYLSLSKSEFDFEFTSKITSDETPEYEFIYYEAKKVGDNPLAIEFTFATRDWVSYSMKPKLHFYIKQNDEKYKPKSVEILEVVGMDEESHYLMSEDGGKIRAVLTFEGVDLSKEFYFVYDNYFQTGRGYAIRFDQ